MQNIIEHKIDKQIIPKIKGTVDQYIFKAGCDYFNIKYQWLGYYFSASLFILLYEQ